MSISIDVDASKAVKGFTNLETNMKRALDSTLQLCGLNATDIVKSTVHVITGNLRDSITVLERGQNFTVIGTNVEYAIYEEMGNQYRPPHPYMEPTADRMQSLGSQIMLNEVRKVASETL